VFEPVGYHTVYRITVVMLGYGLGVIVTAISSYAAKSYHYTVD